MAERQEAGLAGDWSSVLLTASAFSELQRRLRLRRSWPRGCRIVPLGDGLIERTVTGSGTCPEMRSSSGPTLLLRCWGGRSWVEPATGDALRAVQKDGSGNLTKMWADSRQVGEGKG